MANLDEEGAWLRCDMCGVDHDYRCGCDRFSSGHGCGTCAPYYWQWMEIPNVMWREINRFEGRARGGLPKELNGDICRKCATRLTPFVQRFTDIAVVNTYNARLRKAINERKRKQQE